MSPHSFTEDDKAKFIEFLNLIAKHAEFKMKTDELINYFRILAHMQNGILPKIDAHIFEIKRVVEAEKQAEQPEIESKKRK